MDNLNYTYKVIWSDEDQEYVGLCVEFPSLSWLAETKDKALSGIKQIVADVLMDMRDNGESVPECVQESIYLLSNPANTEHLQKAINNLENKRGISVSLDNL